MKKIRGLILVTIYLILSNISTANADDLFSASQNVGFSTETQSGEFLSPGRLESTGTRFELKDSKYLNVSIDSVEQVKLVLESVPEMVTMSLESASDAVSTQITLGGFVPNTTYHKYEDNYHNHMPFTTDSGGNYTYIQDLSTAHMVFIQPRPSTKFIRDDATGGDCALIGIWDVSTKTCTLTTDLSETIQIDSNGIILDGNNHISTGYGTGTGVYMRGRTGVTLKNLTINKFSTGIGLFLSSNNTLSDNNITNSYCGISLNTSRSNTQ